MQLQYKVRLRRTKLSCLNFPHVWSASDSGIKSSWDEFVLRYLALRFGFIRVSPQAIQVEFWNAAAAVSTQVCNFKRPLFFLQDHLKFFHLWGVWQNGPCPQGGITIRLSTQNCYSSNVHRTAPLLFPLFRHRKGWGLAQHWWQLNVLCGLWPPPPTPIRQPKPKQPAAQQENTRLRWSVWAWVWVNYTW